MKFKIRESELDSYIKECITEQNDGKCTIITENLSNDDKYDIKNIIKREVKDFLDTNRNNDFENKVEKKVNEVLKGKANKDMIVEVCKNVLTQLYKSLWTKRNFWSADLKNVPS